MAPSCGVAGLQRDREPAGDQFAVVARDRGTVRAAVISKVTTATWAAGWPGRAGGCATPPPARSVERHHAVGQAAPEAADVPDGEQLGRGFDRDFGRAYVRRHGRR